MQRMDALLRAIEIVGGVTKLADALGVTQPAVSNWLMRKRIPPIQAVAIEHVTGGRVKKSELCPLLFAVTRDGQPSQAEVDA
jgi:DNA-binding transcriptional regulator YdaS (Cro superfamily)